MEVLQYTLTNTEPLSITDLYNSKSDEAETLTYINGAALRGAIMYRIAEAGLLIGDLKKAFYDGRILFGNGYPVLTDDGKEYYSFPSPKGYYEMRDQSGNISHTFTGHRDANMKRAKIGSFAYMDYETKSILFASPLVGENFKTRLARNYTEAESFDNVKNNHSDQKGKQSLFRGSYLEKGQKFSGTIVFTPECTKSIRETVQNYLAMPGMKLGGMRNSGHGSASVTMETIEYDDTRLSIVQNYMKEHVKNDKFYLEMMCVSGLCMANEYGEPCGINEAVLSEKMGIGRSAVRVVNASTSVTHVCSFNRATGGRSPEISIFEGGSVFLLELDQIPSVEALKEIELQGLGLMRMDGYGRVQFCNSIELFGFKKKVLTTCNTVSLSSKLSASNMYQSDVEAMTTTCAKAILKMNMEQAITEYVNENYLRSTKETGSQRGMISLLCKNYRYEPEKAKQGFEEYIRHAEDKDARTRIYRENQKIRSQLLRKVQYVIETPVLALIKLEQDSICGIKVDSLISEKDEILFKLNLLEALMKSVNRTGKE